jgi:hypothetical protein
MLASIIWVAGILLEAVLLLRALQAKLASRYPNFYIYILSLFVSDGLVYAAQLAKHPVPTKLNFDLGFVTLFLGCGVALEIFRHVLSGYPGAEKVARAASYALLAGVAVFAAIYPMVAPNDRVVQAVYVRTERNFVAFQAIALIVIIHVMSYYSVSAGRNLKGMILGYGQALVLSVSALALRAYFGPRFHAAASGILQLSYLASLVIWLIALWSYLPNPRPTTRIRPDDDYGALASRTQGMVDAAGANLVKVERL